MKHFLVSACVLILLAFGACTDQGVAPIPQKPESPRELLIRLAAPSIIEVTWKHSGENVEGFVLSRGSSKFGWLSIDSVRTPSARTYLDHIEKPIMLSSAGRVSYLLWAYNAGMSSQMAVSNEIDY